MGNPRKRIKLGERDRDILQYVGEQGMSWLEAVHAKFYRGRRVDAAKSTLRRLMGRPPAYRYLQPGPLDAKRNYLRLTGPAARMVGTSRAATRPLGRMALIRRYATQWFIEIDGDRTRWLCDPRDYPELFSDGTAPPPRKDFYFEEHETGMLIGLLVVDYGSDARRVGRRTVEMLEQFSRQGWCDPLVAAERLVVTLLSISEGKSRSLELEVEKGCRRRLARWLRRINGNRPARILTDYRVVPGLLDLVTYDHSQGSGRHA